MIQGTATSTSQTTLSSTNGTFILDLNAFKNKTSEEKFVASAETKLLVMAICPDKSRAGYMGSVTTDVGTLPLSQNFPVAEYSTTLTSLPGVTQATITPTTFISPTATATLIPVSPTIRPSITPISSGTVSPTPAVVLPNTDIDDSSQIIYGLFFVLLGFFLRRRIFLGKRKLLN